MVLTKTLESTPLATIAEAFNLAFSDYAIPFVITEERLAEMLRRRGVRLDLSVGVFDGESLAGFTLNGFGEWQGCLTGYDSGTGVVPSARRRGHSQAMMRASKELLKAAGAARYVLEVFQSNDKAVPLYLNSGFRRTRSFLCYRFDGPAPEAAPDGPRIERLARPDWAAFLPMCDFEPSWQNSAASIERAADEKIVLVATRGGNVEGYAIVFPAMSDLAQIAVARDARRRGAGSALLAEARRLASGPLKMINVDENDTGTIAFAERSGATELVRQFEMAAEL